MSTVVTGIVIENGTVNNVRGGGLTTGSNKMISQSSFYRPRT